MKVHTTLLILIFLHALSFGVAAAEPAGEPSRGKTVGWLTALDPIERFGTIDGIVYDLGPAFEPLPVVFRDRLGASLESLSVGMYVAVEYIGAGDNRRATGMRVIEGTFDPDEY